MPTRQSTCWSPLATTPAAHQGLPVGQFARRGTSLPQTWANARQLVYPFNLRGGRTESKEVFMFVRIVLPFAVVLLSAAAVPAQDTRKELEKLQGEWTMVS